MNEDAHDSPSAEVKVSPRTLLVLVILFGLVYGGGCWWQQAKRERALAAVAETLLTHEARAHAQLAEARRIAS